jgi:hypothetical protein
MLRELTIVAMAVVVSQPTPAPLAHGFLLAQNQIIEQEDVMDAQSLRRVQMPNRAGFTSPDPRPDAPQMTTSGRFRGRSRP